MNFTRYAIFYTPAPSPLSEFANRWLGWDPAAGESLSPPQIPDLPVPWREIIDAPRKYGFHGTIKPPFRLAQEQSPEALCDRFEEFCATHQAVDLGKMELAQLGRFLALVPVHPSAAMSDLAGETVREFDSFRAPMDATEFALRQSGNLNPRQATLLQEWGYPYVLDEFRFHLTLTSKLPRAKAAQLCEWLEPLMQPLLSDSFVIDGLSLMGEGCCGMFRVIKRFKLSI